MFKTLHSRLSPPYSGWFSRRLHFADISVESDDSRQSLFRYESSFILTLCLSHPETLFKKSIFYFKKFFKFCYWWCILQKYRTKQYFFESSLISSSCIFSSQYIFFTRRKSKLYLIMRKNFLSKFDFSFSLFLLREKEFVYESKILQLHQDE